MNERIRELIKQSYDELNEPNHDPVAREWLMKDLLPEYQRFAELIVRECQFRVEQYINECGEVASMPDTVIMKHFGVEE